MASDYFRIEPRFWTGPTGKAIRGLGLEARVVATYLLTAPGASAFGLYYMPLPTLCHETGCPFDGASKALFGLERIGFAFYDHEHEVVWVPEMARIQIGEALEAGDKRVKWAQKEVDCLAKLPFFAEFLDKYAKAFHVKPPAGWTRPEQGPPKGDRRGIEAPPKPPALAPTPAVPPRERGPATTPAVPPEQPGPRATGSEEARRAIFDAACRGLGLSLTWNTGNSYRIDRLMAAKPEGPAEVLAVAAHYAANLTPPAQPSFPKFCEQYDERRAQQRRAKSPAAKPGAVPGALWFGAPRTLCEKHRFNPKDCRLCPECAKLNGQGPEAGNV